jgi:hypothetical protein
MVVKAFEELKEKAIKSLQNSTDKQHYLIILD